MSSRRHSSTSGDADSESSNAPPIPGTPNTSSPVPTSPPQVASSSEGNAKSPSTLDSYDRYDQWTGNLILRMVPDPAAANCGNARWAALLCLKCHDLPRLMRERLFWSVDNILPEEGYIYHYSAKPKWKAKGFHHGRHWVLIDKSDGETPNWVGWLQVLSPSLPVVTQFRVQCLSRHLICSANAWNRRHNLIYNYNCRAPEHNYNCIYNNKPLEGWWPWPKEKGEEPRFCPPAPGVSWEDELFPELPLARPRKTVLTAEAPSAPETSSTDREPSNPGCVIL